MWEIWCWILVGIRYSYGGGSNQLCAKILNSYNFYWNTQAHSDLFLKTFWTYRPINSFFYYVFRWTQAAWSQYHYTILCILKKTEPIQYQNTIYLFICIHLNKKTYSTILQENSPVASASLSVAWWSAALWVHSSCSVVQHLFLFMVNRTLSCLNLHFMLLFNNKSYFWFIFWWFMIKWSVQCSSDNGC